MGEKITQKERTLLMGIPIDDLKRALHDPIPLSDVIKDPNLFPNPYSLLKDVDIQDVMLDIRKELKVEIIKKRSKNSKHFLALFDLLRKGKPVSYTNLAEEWGMSKQRVFQIHKKLLTFHAMATLKKILQDAVSFN